MDSRVADNTIFTATYYTDIDCYQTLTANFLFELLKNYQKVFIQKGSVCDKVHFCEFSSKLHIFVCVSHSLSRHNSVGR